MKYKRYKLYSNSLGYYFNLNNRRYYLHNFLRVDNKDYDGYFSISNCYVLLVKIKNDEYVEVKKVIM